MCVYGHRNRWVPHWLGQGHVNQSAERGCGIARMIISTSKCLNCCQTNRTKDWLYFTIYLKFSPQMTWFLSKNSKKYSLSLGHTTPLAGRCRFHNQNNVMPTFILRSKSWVAECFIHFKLYRISGQCVNVELMAFV